MRPYLIFILISILLFLGNCDKPSERIPYAYVNIQKTIDDPELNPVLIPGNYVFLTGGINGIILYRFSNDEFLAWERTCPYKPSENCRVGLEGSDVFAICPCCESQYSLVDGTAVSGPSSYSLKGYQTYFDGYTLRIYN